MPNFDSTWSNKKARRLVTGRRAAQLTTDSDGAERYTATIDIAARDVYSQAHLIPTASLPFSASNQAGYYLLADGTVNTSGLDTPPTNAILRYWHRQQLAETQQNSGDHYFFVKDFAISDTNAGQLNPTIISDKQQTNFISNKYITGSLGALQSEGSAVVTTVGYNITVLIANSTGGPNTAVQIPDTFYDFDYKTGILQFYNENVGTGYVGPDDGVTYITSTGKVPNDFKVYVTAYQYVGKTLNRTIEDLETSIANAGGGGGGGAFISSSNGQTYVSASNNGVSIQVGNVAVGGFSSTSASFSVPISSSINGVGFFGTASWAASASYVTASNVYGPYGSNSIVSASFAYTASNITNAFTNATPASDNQIVFSKGSGTVTGSGQFTVDPTGNSNAGSLSVGGVTLSNSGIGFTDNGGAFNIGVAGAGTQAISIDPNNNGNGLITFNYSASFVGPTTFTNASTATFDDQFILLASGSGAAKDSGIVFEDWSIGGAIGTGSVLFADNANTKRLAYRFTGSVDQTAMTPQAFINMTFVKKPGNDYSFATRTAVDDVIGDNVGYMWLDENGDIYIKS